jgi:hypothetical protein
MESISVPEAFCLINMHTYQTIFEIMRLYTHLSTFMGDSALTWQQYLHTFKSFLFWKNDLFYHRETIRHFAG